MAECMSDSNIKSVSLVSPRNEYQKPQELVQLETTLKTYNIPIQQPTIGFNISHIGFPRLSSMAEWIRKGKGLILLTLRVILVALSVLVFFIAMQQDYIGVMLSGNPWLPLTEVIGSPVELLTVLLSEYIVVPINLVLGQLILLYLDLPIYWLFKDDNHRLSYWVIISTFVWFIAGLTVGLFVEGAITWGLVLFPEGVGQMPIVLLGGVFISGMIELVFLFAFTREIIRVTHPKLMQIEGRFIAVRDYVTNRRYMKRPFSAISKYPAASFNHSIFMRESLMNWIRVLILIGLGIGIDLVLPDFGMLPLVPLIESIFLLLVVLIVLGLASYIVISGLRRGIRTFWSAFLFITFVIIVEGMFLSLFCGIFFALASMGAGLLVLIILNLRVRQLVDDNPGLLNPIYFRYLLAKMSPNEAHSFIEDTLNQLNEVLPQPVQLS